MLSLLISAFQALLRLALATIAGAVALFCILWAASIIGNDVIHNVSPFDDKIELAILLAIGVVALVEFIQMFVPGSGLVSEIRTRLERFMFSHFNWHQPTGFDQEAFKRQIATGSDEYLRSKTMSPSSAQNS